MKNSYLMFVIAVLVFTPFAMGALIGFEAPEYSLGLLTGQNNWTHLTNSWDVVATASDGAYVGGQAISPNGGTDCYAILTPIVPTQGSEISLAFDVFTYINVASGNMQMRIRSVTTGKCGPYFGIQNGQFVIQAANFGVKTIGNTLDSSFNDKWIRMKMVVDEAAETGTLYAWDLSGGGAAIDTGVVNATLNLTANNVTVDLWDRWDFRSANYEARMFDNLSFVVPEPTMLVMLGLGGLLLRRKHQ